MNILQTVAQSRNLPPEYRVTRLTVHEACTLFDELRELKAVSGSLLVFITMGRFTFKAAGTPVTATWPNVPTPQLKTEEKKL